MAEIAERLRRLPLPSDLDLNVYDKLLELGVRLGVAEQQSSTAARAIEAHTADCAEFRGKILERIDGNRVLAENRHDTLVTQLHDIAAAQQRTLFKIGCTIIGVLVSGVGTLGILLIKIKLGIQD